MRWIRWSRNQTEIITPSNREETAMLCSICVCISPLFSFPMAVYVPHISLPPLLRLPLWNAGEFAVLTGCAVLTATGFSMTPTESTPLKRSPKLVTGDYVGDPTPEPHPSRGGLLCK